MSGRLASSRWSSRRRGAADRRSELSGWHGQSRLPDMVWARQLRRDGMFAAGRRARGGVLIRLDGEDPTRTVALSRQLTLIGREYDNDIVIDDERTSRHHAELRWEHGHVQLLDRGSMNGTRLNRQAVRGVVPLKSGDILEVGAQRYLFEMAATGAANGAEEETRKMRGALHAEALAAVPALVLVGIAGGARA